VTVSTSKKRNDADARTAARAEAQRLKDAQAKRERTRRLALIGGIVGVVVIAAVVVALVLTSSAKKPTAAPTGSDGTVSAPLGATDTGGILLGKDLAPGGEAPAADDVVTVEVISDFMCPICNRFEQQFGEQLKQKAEAGEIRLVVHPLAYLDSFSTTEYSTRSANDAITVAALDPAHFTAFTDALWANQPEENGPGLSDDELASLAQKAGVSSDAMAQFTAKPLAKWVTWSTDQAVNAPNFRGTPQVRMSIAGGDPQDWTWGETASLDDAIAKVKAGGSPNG
jgi:protein-disulfide isomerase